MSGKALRDILRSVTDSETSEVDTKYAAYKESLTTRVVTLIKKSLPSKFFSLNEFLNELEKYSEVEFNAEEIIKKAKAQALESQINVNNPASSQTENDDKSTESSTEITPVDTLVLCHHKIQEVSQKLRYEALEFIEACETTRLWISLNVPRVEDGDNFGVGVQDGVMQEIGRFEETAFGYIDNLRYHALRGRLITKVLKYPNVEDYTASVIEADHKEWVLLRNGVKELRNYYGVLYELLNKNWEKLVLPRATARGGYMVM